MIVLDASAALEVLLQTRLAGRISVRAFASNESLHAPDLLNLEVAQVLRRYLLSGEVAEERADQAFSDLTELPLTYYAHSALLPRVWDLRHSLSAYDASYVALAEALDAPLLTTDRRLARTHGHNAHIEQVS